MPHKKGCFGGEVSAPKVLRFLLIALFVCSAGAQTNTGRLEVIVLDGSNAVVRGAGVTLTDGQSLKAWTAFTDDSGIARFPLLDVGSYTLGIRHTGFKTYTAENLAIEIGREYSLRAVLEAGSEAISITVYAGPALENTTTPELSTTINARQIRNLPLDGRDPLDLVLLQAGISSSRNQYTSINGQRTAFTNITRDGINIQDALFRANATDFAPGRPSVDDVEEFTVSTQNSGAERGYGSAQIHFVTPRGSTEFHGGVWAYNRNAALGANDFFSNKTGQSKPFRNRNQFGGKLGGPVPSMKNKVFFFAFYEAIRDSQKSLADRILLRPESRNGIFTYWDNGAGGGEPALRTIDLFSLVPEITATNPVIRSRLLPLMPESGNRPDLGDGLNTEGITFSQPSDTDRNTFTTRVDYNASRNQDISLVFTRNKETNRRPDQNGNEGFYPNHPVVQSSANRQFTVAHRWVKSPTFNTEVRGGAFWSDVPFRRTIDTPAYFIQSGSFFSNPEVTFLNQGRNFRTYNLQNHSEKLIADHSLRFGGQMQMFQVNPYNYAGVVPTFQTGINPNTPQLTADMFKGGISATQLNNANTLFAFLGGILSGGSQSFNVRDKKSGFQTVPKFEDYRYSDYAVYISDQWRLSPYLTLNLGLRYEILTPVRQLNGLALEPVIPSGTDPVESILNPEGYYDYIGGNAGGGNRLYRTDWNNAGPVLGFAYLPRFDSPVLRTIAGRTAVIRGGYRQSYVNDSNLSAARNASQGNYGLGTTTVKALNPETGTDQLNARPGSLPQILPPEIHVPRTYAQNNTPFGIVFAIDPDIQTTRVHEYSFGIQRSLGWGTVLEVRYAGSRSNNLWRGADYNQIDIRRNGFAEDFDRARRNLVANNDPAVGEGLTIFPLLSYGGLLSNSTVRFNLLNGTPADLAYLYVANRLAGSVDFLPNPNTGIADYLSNSARYRYDSLQIEIRKQLESGFYFQSNYTWQKILTDAVGTSTGLFDAYLDLENPGLEYTRADYDMTHVFNFNTVFDLPVGRKKRFGTGFRPALDAVLGGWQLSGIVRITSGTPVTIVDPRGTLNRQGRSSRQTPDLSISKEQLRALTGRFETTNGIYFIDPSVVNPSTGRAAEGYGSDPFPGQVFFNAAPGRTGSMGRALLDGPGYFNADLAVFKNFPLPKNVTLQMRLEAFNALNHANFYLESQFQDINSTDFGLLRRTWGPREVQVSGRLKF